MIRRVAFALIVGGVVARGASAQDTSAAGPASSNPSTTAQPTTRVPALPEAADVPPLASKPVDPAATAKRAIARPVPLPRRASSTQMADSILRREMEGVPGRFANPGGVGRYPEYYTANTPTSQANRHPTPRPGFDRGGGPDRAAQVAAFRAGQARTSNIQNNINAYGRPYGAYGAGFGFGFGLGYGLYGGGLRGGGLR